MGVTKLQSRGQLTIPAHIRHTFGWKPGDSIAFVARADGVIELRAVKTRTVQELVHTYSHDGVAPNLERFRQAEADDRFGDKFGGRDST